MLTTQTIWDGYHACPCRDCFDVAIGATPDRDTRGRFVKVGPALCGDCEDAGCDPDGDCECRRDDAYGVVA